MPQTLRAAQPSDVPTILSLIRALADYEKLVHEVSATEESLRQSLFPDDGQAPHAYCLLAEVENTPAGFALYFFNYSTFLAKPGLYLEDLFVRPEFRGQAWARRCCCTWPNSPTPAIAGGWSGPFSTGTGRQSSFTNPSVRSA